MQTWGDNKINQVFFISTKRELTVNRMDLQSFTIVGPPLANPGPGPHSCATP